MSEWLEYFTSIAQLKYTCLGQNIGVFHQLQYLDIHTYIKINIAILCRYDKTRISKSYYQKKFSSLLSAFPNPKCVGFKPVYMVLYKLILCLAGGRNNFSGEISFCLSYLRFLTLYVLVSNPGTWFYKLILCLAGGRDNLSGEISFCLSYLRFLTLYVLVSNPGTWFYKLTLCLAGGRDNLSGEISFCLSYLRFLTLYVLVSNAGTWSISYFCV